MNIGLNTDFQVPVDLIAQAPAAQRDRCRLMVYNRREERCVHEIFEDLPKYLESGDALVLNQTKVRPARVMAQKTTGGRIEVLFLEPQDAGIWKVLLQPFLDNGKDIQFPTGDVARVVGRTPDGEVLLSCPFDPLLIMEKHGRVPLPPYIKRPQGIGAGEGDQNWYQTVYARFSGSVAAPTAGLHFSTSLLQCLEQKGVRIVFITLHIGWGTFRPIRSSNLQNHKMLAESFEVKLEAASEMTNAWARSRRVIGVGTSVVRALESCLDSNGTLEPRSGRTDLFIQPPHLIKSIDGFVTNFHLPHSTPLALVDALIGSVARDKIYKEALQRRYRFYSYGDAMLIL